MIAGSPAPRTPGPASHRRDLVAELESVLRALEDLASRTGRLRRQGLLPGSPRARRPGEPVD